VNHCSLRKVQRSVAFVSLICTAAAALVMPVRAYAQLTGTASATSQYESNSNVYALATGTAQSATNNSRTADFAFGASLDGNYAFGRQQLYATASATKEDYQGSSQLSHNEYSFNTGLKWKLGDLLDGTVGISRTHTMVPFLDLTGSALTLSIMTSQQETLQIGLVLNPEWKLEGSASTSKTTQPFEGLNQPPVSGGSNQQLTQNSGTASIEYSGVGPLTSGLSVGYSTGDNGGATGVAGAADSTYSQYMAGFLANYKLERTSFDGQLGYSRRTSDDGLDVLSGLTGLIDFKDQLTPKTGFTIRIDRIIQTLYLNLGSEFDTDAGVSVLWQATYKLGVSLGYTFTRRDVTAQAEGSAGASTVAYQQNGTLEITYEPLRWLSIKPYANIQTRHSDTPGQNFNANVYGITLAASVGGDKVK
jgi:hypothetical protein